MTVQTSVLLALLKKFKSDILEQSSIPGPRGKQGARGEAGFNGARGDDGEIGQSGPQGDRGPMGETGPKGDKGDRGERGDTGETGTAGQSGIDGKDGLQGPTGPQGPAGIDGTKGDPGIRGESGPQGLVGPSGADGSDGKVGAKGEKGISGTRGKTGPKGAKGDAGPSGKDGTVGKIGPKGSKGDKGSIGESGPKGEAGEQGPKGEPGPALEKPDFKEMLDDALVPQYDSLNKWRENVNKSLSSIGGGGSYKILDNSDVEKTKLSDAVQNAILIYDAQTKKFVVTDIAEVIAGIQIGLEMQYTRLIDEDGDNTYIGEADPGTSQSTGTWRIKKVYTNPVTKDVDIEWADGTADFIKIWDDRLSYTYS